MPLSRAVTLLASAGLLACLQAPAVRGQDLSGYVKNFTLGFQLPEADPSGGGFVWQSANRLRLKYRHSLGRGLSFDGAWEVLPRFQSEAFYRTALFPFSIDPSSYRLVDFHAQVYPGADRNPGRFALFQNLDRLSLFWKTSAADVTVGRQPIAWGSALVVNPTDIIAPFAFNDLDKEEVFGVDAIRVRIPTGSLSEVDLGYVPGRDFRFGRSAFFARRRVNVWHTDGTLMAVGFRKNLLVGLDLSRSVGPAGLNFGAAYVIAGALGDTPTVEKDYLRVSVDLDGNVTSRFYLYGEYHYNSAGGKSPEQYASLFSTTAYRQGNVYLLGRHYLMAGGNYQVTPLNTVAWLILWNTGDRSFDFWPSWEYNLAANAYLQAGTNIGVGRAPNSWPTPAPLALRSEFGSYPRLFYVSLRYYF